MALTRKYPDRVEKYASYTIDANGTAVTSDASVKETPAEAQQLAHKLSPPLKASGGGGRGQTDQDVAGGGAAPAPSHGKTSQHGPIVSSPPLIGVREGTATTTPSWPAEGTVQDLHISGSQPRVFPGVVARSQTRGGTRQNSMHESDDSGPAGRAPRG